MLIAQLSKPVTLTFASAVSDQIETTTNNIGPQLLLAVYSQQIPTIAGD
jgi:hypothetical protein